MIGSGPAGLACAHDLALMGYPVTIFEAAPVAGGMLRLGVPEYRLPRALIQLEVNAILSLGVELQDQRAARPRLHARRPEGRRASRRSSSESARCAAATSTIPGTELDGVLRGDRLPAQRQPRLQGRDGPARRRHRRRQRGPRRRAHGGARRRAGEPPAQPLHRPGARRGAQRRPLRRARGDRLLPRVGERDARREGGDRGGDARGHPVPPPGRAQAPRRREGDGDRRRVPRRSPASSTRPGRFSPQFVEGSETIFPTDTVIIAIGQTGDFSFLRPEDGIETRAAAGSSSTPRRSRRPRPGVYAGGDAAFGPRIAINADRRRKERRRGRSTSTSAAGRARGATSPSRSTSTPATSGTSTSRGSRARSRRRGPISRRIGIAEVEECFGEREARREGNALPALLDQHDLRAGSGGGDRVHPLRRLPGHLPGGLHRDPAGGAGHRAPAEARRARADPRRTAARAARSSSRTRRPASAAASAPRAARWARSPCRASTRRRTPLPEDPESLARNRRRPVRAGATSSAASASAPAPRRRPDPASSRSTT